MPNLLRLDRRTLSQLLQGNAQAIAVFERMLGDVGDVLPTTIEEANALAGEALAAAQMAFSMAAALADALAQQEGAPAAAPQADPDDTTPRAQLGTMAAQDDDQVAIAGGTIDGTTIGQTTAAAAKFTTMSASNQITSTVAIGTPPLVIASTTRVPNLNVANAGAADGLTSPSSYPAAATDLASCIALANALRTAAISKGL